MQRLTEASCFIYKITGKQDMSYKTAFYTKSNDIHFINQYCNKKHIFMSEVECLHPILGTKPPKTSSFYVYLHCICLFVNAPVLRQRWSIPHCMVLFQASFVLTGLAWGVAPLRFKEGPCLQIKNSWPSHENWGIPHMQIQGSVFFI